MNSIYANARECGWYLPISQYLQSNRTCQYCQFCRFLYLRDTLIDMHCLCRVDAVKSHPVHSVFRSFKIIYLDNIIVFVVNILSYILYAFYCEMAWTCNIEGAIITAVWEHQILRMLLSSLFDHLNGQFSCYGHGR
jgi:hypothetical protein